MIEKECLASLSVLQHFQVYLSVTLQPVLVYTDHNTNLSTKNGKQKSRDSQDGFFLRNTISL